MRAATAASGSRSLARLGAARLRGRVAHPALLQSLPAHIPPTPDTDDDDESELRRRRHLNSMAVRPYHGASVRAFHGTAAVDRAGPALAMGLGAVALAAKAGQLTVRAYREWKESLPEEPSEEETKKAEEEARAKSEDAKAKDDGTKKKKGKAAAGGEGKRENFFAKFFGAGVGSKYYEGGFEDTMTRREAALILGVRESSTTKRIKEAHRKLLILNHPDTGGSTYVSGKINEAKELLLKGRKDA